MAEKLLKDVQIAEALGLHRASIWRLAKSDPNFPQPIRLGERMTRFRATDLEAWINSKEA